MYSIKTDTSFDSAHFLHGHDGKCSNIHGHHWRISANISSPNLNEEGAERGMIVDFSRFKGDLKEEAEQFDHSLMFERGTLRENTVRVLEEEGFKLVILEFRPTAENLAKYFFDQLKAKGYPVRSVEIYETPKNCAVYSE